MHLRRPRQLLCASLLLALLLLWGLLLVTEDARGAWVVSGRFPLARGRPLWRWCFGGAAPAPSGVNFPSLLASPGAAPRCEPGQVLLILVTSAPGNWEQRRVIRRTWGAQDEPAPFHWQAVFLVGQAADAGTASRIRQEQQDFGDILVGNYRDTYRNLTLKVMHGLKWAAERCRPRYVLKTDDDCFVNTDRLPGFLAQLDPVPARLYAGSVFSREKRQVIREPSSKWYVSRQDYGPDKYPPYASGIGYVLSLEAAAQVLAAAERVRPIPVEDAYVGILAEAAGIRAQASTRFAKHNVQWRVCNYRYLMVIHHLSPPQQEAARRSMLQARNACRDSLEVTRWR
ncbi:beta-1,3-galactosyltransferase 5-like [Alligator sinensis]|uniref:Hexosyltransferase n=1 Tax=Alligator sinensis TaxID=38654 RepID=A0A1U8DXJ2_ALLSI|nr:beta-1,3-galactosyltransferase 5-like [Alligator sinensis]